jgi:hypothetical protein
MMARLAAVTVRGNLRVQGMPKPHPRESYMDTKMPEIHEEHPMGPLVNIDSNQIQDWTYKVTTGKVLARPFGTDVHYIPNHRDIANDLMSAIKEITGLSNVSVAEPDKAPIVCQETKIKTPMTFLIHDLSDNDVTLLTDRQVWASQNLTFEIIPFPPKRPSFLFTISGIATHSEDNIKELILKTWKDTNSEAFFDTFLQETPPLFQNALYHEINRYIDSIDIKRLEIKMEGGRDDPHFNVYANSALIPNTRIWLDTRNFLRKCIYRSSTLGRGNVELNKFHCRLCHGKDHPKGLCPFPKIPGWKGPTRPDRPERNQPINQPNCPRRSLPHPEGPRERCPAPRRSVNRNFPY